MNGNLKKMREKRNEIIAAMEAVVNAAAAEERSLTDDEITAYNGRRDELTRIDATIAALENVRSAERNEEHQPEGDEKLTPEERSFVSFLRGEIRVDVNTTKPMRARSYPLPWPTALSSTSKTYPPSPSMQRAMRVSAKSPSPMRTTPTRCPHPMWKILKAQTRPRRS